MFDFLKRKKKPDDDLKPEIETTKVVDENDAKETRAGLFSRLKNGLAKTRASFSSGLANLFLGKKELNTELLTEIETALLSADVGVETTEQLIKTLTQKLARKELSSPEAAFDCLKQEMLQILTPCSKPLVITDQKPFVILVIGVNGSGKTTTIGKLAKYYQHEQKQIMLAAAELCFDAFL